MRSSHKYEALGNPILPNNCHVYWLENQTKLSYIHRIHCYGKETDIKENTVESQIKYTLPIY